MIFVDTKDSDLIKRFMTSDEVWDNLSDDMSDKLNYEPDLSTGSLWLKVMINDNFAGLALMENYNLTTLKLHPYLLKGYKIYSRELIKELLTLFLKTPAFVNKLVVEIPTHRKIVYNLAKKIGFVDEGINRGSFLKNGVFLDQWNLGLTKKEVKNITWEI